MAEGANFLHLPEDVIMEILSRLPVKSLLRFKTVCKYWFYLIQSPTFIGRYPHGPNNPAKLFVHCYHVNGGDSSLFLFPDDYLAGTFPLYQDHVPIPTPFSAVLGPLDGLVFLYDDHDRMVLWNPATREFKHLPPIVQFPVYSHEISLSLYSHVFGFGMDPLFNDFKVVWVRDYWDDDREIWQVPVISVYSSSTDSWRHFRDNTFSSLHVVKSYSNTYWNGFYYWRAVCSCKIYAFDMGSEVFREVQTPDAFKTKQGDLALYDNSIATFVYNRGTEVTVDIWVMDMAESWTKKITIGPLLNIRRALGSWKNGEVFIETGTLRLALVDPKTKEMKDLGPQRNCYCLQVSSYKESVISIRKLSSKNWKTVMSLT